MHYLRSFAAQLQQPSLSRSTQTRAAKGCSLTATTLISRASSSWLGRAFDGFGASGEEAENYRKVSATSRYAERYIAIMTTQPHRPSEDRAIAPWRFVAGVFVHCVVPAYLVVLPIAFLFSAKIDLTYGAIVRTVLRLSGLFLAGYTTLAVVAITAAHAVAPVVRWRTRRRSERDRAQRSVSLKSDWLMP